LLVDALFEGSHYFLLLHQGDRLLLGHFLLLFLFVLFIFGVLLFFLFIFFVSCFWQFFGFWLVAKFYVTQGVAAQLAKRNVQNLQNCIGRESFRNSL
jgi:hypothetical protein